LNKVKIEEINRKIKIIKKNFCIAFFAIY